METLITPFSAFRLSEEELAKARALQPEQKAYYQTLLADAAAEKIAIEPDVAKFNLFIQQEAFLRGQMSILNMLLGLGDVSQRPHAPESDQPEVPQP